MMNTSYIGARRDLVALIPDGARTILDLGCASGASAELALAGRPDRTAVGIELDEAMAAQAATRMTEVLHADAIEGLERLAARGETFDVVLCGDILEHLVDPWRALALVRALCPEGRAIVSLPNVAHYSTFVALASGRWPYRARGIHDRTHLRWFARRNLAELFAGAGFAERARHTSHRVWERPHPINALAAPVVRRVPLLRELTSFQFISVLAPVEET